MWVITRSEPPRAGIRMRSLSYPAVRRKAIRVPSGDPCRTEIGSRMGRQLQRPGSRVQQLYKQVRLFLTLALRERVPSLGAVQCAVPRTIDLTHSASSQQFLYLKHLKPARGLGARARAAAGRGLDRALFLPPLPSPRLRHRRELSRRLVARSSALGDSALPEAGSPKAEFGRGLRPPPSAHPGRDYATAGEGRGYEHQPR
jgi:hypothetical protein